jgi:hypothetical protein
METSVQRDSVSLALLVGVLVLEISEGQIAAVRAMANPDKLRFASRQIARFATAEPPSGGTGTVGRPLLITLAIRPAIGFALLLVATWSGRSRSTA